MSATRNNTLDDLLSGNGNARIRRVKIGGLTGFAIGSGTNGDVTDEWLDELLAASPDRLKEMIAEEGEDTPCPRCRQRHYGSGFMTRLNLAIGGQKSGDMEFAAGDRTWEEDLADALTGKLAYNAPAEVDAEAEMVGQLLADSVDNDRPTIIRMLGRLKLDLTVSDELLVAQTRTSKRLSQNLLALKKYYKGKLKALKKRIGEALDNIWRSDRDAFDTSDVESLLERVRDGLGENEHYVPQDGQHELEAEIDGLINALATFGQQVEGQALSADQIKQAVTNITAGKTEACGRYFTPAETPMVLISEEDLARLRAQAAIGERTMTAFEYVSTERPDLEALAKLLRQIEDGKLSVEDEIEALYPATVNTQSEGN